MDSTHKGISPDKLSATCLFIIAVILTAAALNYTSAMMIPFAISFFFSLILRPAVVFLQKRLRLPRIIVVILVLILSAFILTLFTQLLKNTVLDVFDSIDIYQARLSSAVDSLLSLPLAATLGLDKAQILNVFNNLPVLTYVQNLTGHAVSIASNLLLVFVFVFFILSGQSKTYVYNTSLGTAIDLQIRRYLVTKLASSGITGLLVGTVLGALGVDLYLMFGVFTFILNFIPTIGSIVATLLPIPVVILQFDSLIPTVLALSIPTAIQFLIGTVIEPKILGRNLDMHPVTILMSLIFWGLIWGIVGMFLAVPIMAALKLILEKFEGTKFIADLMSGRVNF